MKNLGEILLSGKVSTEILMGNYALVRAFVETGTKIVTSYPGSPVTEVADGIKTIPADKRPFYFEFSTNEIVAAEVALGASINGNLSCVFFKSVGLNVAADCFVQLSSFNLIGGMVIVLGDDPGAHSSQNEQDNRHFAKLSYTPVFEPASPSEVLSFYKTAAEVSVKNHMPVILRLTTHVCHAKEKVKLNSYTLKNNEFKTDFNAAKNGPYIPLMPNITDLKLRALKRLEAVEIWSETSAINKLHVNNNKRGIITFGLPYLSLFECLKEKSSSVDILKLGLIHPLPKKAVINFLREHEEIKILEELDDILEQAIKSVAYDNKLNIKIIGKTSNEDYIGEYTPDKVQKIMAKVWPDIFRPKADALPHENYVGQRHPQMCPGCGHRSAFYAIKQALCNTDITVADIGCHSLGFLPPYQIGEILVCMGASIGVGAGLSLKNNSRRVIAFIGDSTFFHAGLPGIINAVFNKHNLTLIVMENNTTAMTGHQDHPAVGENFNASTEKIPIRSVLEGIGVNIVAEIDTYSQKKLTEAVLAAKEQTGFNVIIAKHICMLKFTREHRTIDTKVKQVEVNRNVCSNLEKCIASFGCPSFTRHKDGSITVNKDLCIGDGSCIQTCPKQAIEKSTND